LLSIVDGLLRIGFFAPHEYTIRTYAATRFLPVPSGYARSQAERLRNGIVLSGAVRACPKTFALIQQPEAARESFGQTLRLEEKVPMRA
jgi:hypothetical protein